MSYPPGVTDNDFEDGTEHWLAWDEFLEEYTTEAHDIIVESAEQDIVEIVEALESATQGDIQHAVVLLKGIRKSNLDKLADWCDRNQDKLQERARLRGESERDNAD